MMMIPFVSKPPHRRNKQQQEEKECHLGPCRRAPAFLHSLEEVRLIAEISREITFLWILLEVQLTMEKDSIMESASNALQERLTFDTNEECF